MYAQSANLSITVQIRIKNDIITLPILLKYIALEYPNV